MPSPVSDKTSKYVFKEANEKMKQCCEKSKNSTFLDICKQFIKEGKIIESLYADGVHLTKDGTILYLNCLKKHLFWKKF